MEHIVGIYAMRKWQWTIYYSAKDKNGFFVHGSLIIKAPTIELAISEAKRNLYENKKYAKIVISLAAII